MPSLRDVARGWLAIAGVVLLLPAAAYAQAIAGEVRDDTGGVLPGVTVEASSPALIGAVRTAVTDGAGLFRIEGLRPGVYGVTFVLPGFATVRSEGIELSGAFVATVNVELPLAGLEETITVTGETPVVDVQSAGRQTVLTAEAIDELPVNRMPQFMAALQPAVSMTGGSSVDIGGSAGPVPTGAGVTVHGSRQTDLQLLANGLSVNNFFTGSAPQGVANMAQYQEVTIDLAGGEADQPLSGVRINLIPAEGGNTHSGTVLATFMNDAFQGSNFDEDLEARGLAVPNKINRNWDVNPTFGGPLVVDRLWYFVTARSNAAWSFQPVFANLNAGNADAWLYEPDLNEQAVRKVKSSAASGRLTWQATPANKFQFSYGMNSVCNCQAASARNAPETAGSTTFGNKQTFTADWTAAVNNNLLVEASFLTFRLPRLGLDAGSWVFERVQERTTGLSYRGQSDTSEGLFLRKGYRAAMSYVTGSYTLKVGFNGADGSSVREDYLVGLPVEYRFRRGVPEDVTVLAVPHKNAANIDQETGIYAQGRLTRQRLTLSGGVRFDYYKTSFPETTIGPSKYTPNRNITFPKTDGLAWKDISPRSGLAFDVFGNGRTALKVTAGRYLAGQGLEGSGNTPSTRLFGRELIPSRRVVTSSRRGWDDANGNFIPDCDLVNQAANGECERGNLAFGTPVPANATYNPDILSGWGNRAYNWEFSAGVQQEIAPRTSLEVSYFRRVFANWAVVDNLEVTPDDFDAYTVTAPSDPGLPGGGGFTVTALDVSPEKVGLEQNFITFASDYGDKEEYWHGVDVTVNARPTPDLRFSGGLSTGRAIIDDCAIFQQLPELLVDADLPREFCRVEESFVTNVKMNGSYILPRIDVQFSATFQSLPGPEVLAEFDLTRRQATPLLGRRLSGRSSTTNIVSPGTLFGDRRNQLDLRVAKVFRSADGTRLNVGLDIANVFNANPVISEAPEYDSWRTPESILPARFFKLSVTASF